MTHFPPLITFTNIHRCCGGSCASDVRLPARSSSYRIGSEILPRDQADFGSESVVLIVGIGKPSRSCSHLWLVVVQGRETQNVV